MTDRVRHLTVTLTEDIRVDDVESIVAAIRQLRGVSLVKRRVVDGADHLARMAVRAELEVSLHEAVRRAFHSPAGRDGSDY